MSTPKFCGELATKIGDENTNFGGGVAIDRLLCPNDVRFFYPYYLSGIDALFWREGFPINDLVHAKTILNPFSGDRIRPSGSPLIANWGHVYPREGFLNNDHPGRAAAVTAYRGAHLLPDRKVKLRPKITTDDAKGYWQKVSPDATNYCTPNIADLPTKIDSEGGYAYNIWPLYICPLSEVGVLVAFIPFRFCFSD